jgi:hypothetical protein
VTVTGDAIGPEPNVLIRGHRALFGVALFPAAAAARPRPRGGRKRHTRGRRTPPWRFEPDRDWAARTASLGPARGGAHTAAPGLSCCRLLRYSFPRCPGRPGLKAELQGSPRALRLGPTGPARAACLGDKMSLVAARLGSCAAPVSDCRHRRSVPHPRAVAHERARGRLP